MNLTRIATFGALAGGLAALVAGAATSGVRHVQLPPPVRTTGIDTSSAQLANEIARLHERLRPTASPQRARDLFRFSVPPPPPSAARSHAAAIDTVPVQAPARDVKLIGIAEDLDAAGSPVRTAIISGGGELFLVKEGELVQDRFRVSKISADAVELSDGAEAPIRLALK